MGMIINPARFGAAAPLGVSYIGATEQTANATTYNFTNHAIGAADATRIVYAVVY